MNLCATPTFSDGQGNGGHASDILIWSFLLEHGHEHGVTLNQGNIVEMG